MAEGACPAPDVQKEEVRFTTAGDESFPDANYQTWNTKSIYQEKGVTQMIG